MKNVIIAEKKKQLHIPVSTSKCLCLIQIPVLHRVSALQEAAEGVAMRETAEAVSAREEAKKVVQASAEAAVEAAAEAAAEEATAEAAAEAEAEAETKEKMILATVRGTSRQLIGR